MLRFQRPEPAGAAGGGAGAISTGCPARVRGSSGRSSAPGLRRLADLAPLAPEALAARLGPIGRLVPAEAWIAGARGDRRLTAAGKLSFTKGAACRIRSG